MQTWIHPMQKGLTMQRIASMFALTILASAASAQIVGSTDATGTTLIERLMENSGLPASAVATTGRVFSGQTVGGSQSGLCGALTLHGANDTSLTLPAGIVLSSGLVTGLPATNTTWSYSNVTNSGTSNFFRDFPAQTGTTRHSGRLQEHDTNELTFDLEVPAGIVGVRAEFVYASDEFPEWSGTAFADGFAFIVDDVNYAKLPDGRPVSLLSENDNIHFMTNGDQTNALVPLVANMEYDGMTRVLEVTAPLRPDRTNTITIVVADTGDEIYDSAVFISSLRFIEGTAPIDPADCHVRVRHSSSDDASFVEFGQSGCDDIDFNNNGVYPEDLDILDFLNVLAGAACSECHDIDFNNNDVFPEDQDVVDFFNVLAGGNCSQ